MNYENLREVHPLIEKYEDVFFAVFPHYEVATEQIYTAIYVRVSSERQYKDGTSIETQINECIEEALKLGIPAENIRIYIEGGESGEDIDRPEMNRLREDSERGFIKNVIITHPDRFSREMVGKLQVCAEFERQEINLIFLLMTYSDKPEDKLFFTMISAIAQYELEQIKRRTRKGIRKAVQNKKRIQPMRVSPFGYDLVDGKFVKNEEAYYVGKIFEWYIDGLTMREIGERLYLENVKPKRGESESWNQSSIQKILKNENYIGNYYYNRKKTKKIKGQRTKMGKPKKTYTIREDSEWWIINDHDVVPPIIDYEIFFKAQARRLLNWKEKGQIKHDYLLSRLIYCDCCKIKFSPYTSSSQQTSKKTGETKKWYYKRYRCQNKNPRKYGGEVHKCPLPILDANQLDEFIWNNYILGTISDVELIKQKFLDLEEQGQDPKHDELNRLNNKLEIVKEEKNRVLFQNQKGWKSDADTEKEMEKLLNDEQVLDLKIEELTKQLSNKTNAKKSKEKIIDSAFEISEFLKNGMELDFENKKRIVDLLINEIIVSAGKAENEIIIEVNGIIDSLKINSMIERMNYSLLNSKDDLLRHPRPQPQTVVNKDYAVFSKNQNADKALYGKDSQSFKAYTTYVFKMTIITDTGNKTKFKCRRNKFLIS